MKKVFIGLGSDLGNREANLRKAVEGIGKDAGRVTAVSPLYETEPVGFKGGGDFLNMVISVETILSPSDFLEKLMMLESAGGRVRSETRNISRTIDIDILLFDNEVIYERSLTIPHPRMHARRFVLVPLNDLAPGLVHPVFVKTISELLAECKDESRIRLFKSTSPYPSA
jgi:2-amino-4-hydroxy-6-hydroxymethyldihydropteridine diphosphokinase